MKKTGFTLAEILVTLGIIAVLAAITMPLLGSITPDKKKVMVIKYKKVLTELAAEVANDPALYWRPADKYCIALGCYTEIPPVTPYNDAKYTGVNKFRNILWSKLEGTEESNEDYFNTADGMRLKYTANSSTVSLGGNSYQLLDSIITMDVDGQDKGNNCAYSSSCKKPDQFKFWINTYGKVEGCDPLTVAYLKNSSKLNDKKKDLSAASKDSYNYESKAKSSLEYK